MIIRTRRNLCRQGIDGGLTVGGWGKAYTGDMRLSSRLFRQFFQISIHLIEAAQMSDAVAASAAAARTWFQAVQLAT